MKTSSAGTPNWAIVYIYYWEWHIKDRGITSLRANYVKYVVLSFSCPQKVIFPLLSLILTALSWNLDVNLRKTTTTTRLWIKIVSRRRARGLLLITGHGLDNGMLMVTKNGLAKMSGTRPRNRLWNGLRNRLNGYTSRLNYMATRLELICLWIGGCVEG